MEGSVRARRSRRLPRRLRPTPYSLRSCRWATTEVVPNKILSIASERKDWEDATCSVCMEFPHNAVLLLCSSHDKGCRPYMCGTSYRHSNCLDQFKKAYAKSTSVLDEQPTNLAVPAEKSEVVELAACPLCRGQVKGWTVVEPAREYLNSKKRSCMQDECSFVGSYKELQKHVRSAHPCAKPREVDPTLEQKWRRLEHEREREDVMSTIRSSMPRSVVFGDYVIEMTSSDLEGLGDDEVVIGGADVAAGGRGISRSILYFFLREGARLMRLQREPNGVASAIVDSSGSIDVGGGNADVEPIITGLYSSGGDEDYEADHLGQNRGITMLRAERRRRRRRRRSRGRSVVGPS